MKKTKKIDQAPTDREAHSPPVCLLYPTRCISHSRTQSRTHSVTQSLTHARTHTDTDTDTDTDTHRHRHTLSLLPHPLATVVSFALLKPVQRIKSLVLIQNLQDVRHTYQQPQQQAARSRRHVRQKKGGGRQLYPSSRAWWTLRSSGEGPTHPSQIHRL